MALVLFLLLKIILPIAAIVLIVQYWEQILAGIRRWLFSNEIVGRVHTLSYTGRGLFMVFFWLLLGDFCVQVMWQVFPKVTPVVMESMGSKNVMITWVCVMIPTILTAIICPWVSFKSDRHRSKWGRRRPFMLLPTLMTTVFLILMGLAPDIGRQLHHLFVRFHFSEAQVALALIAVFSVGFQYFNMFIDSVYWYLFADVVPAEFLSRFNGFFRTVSFAAGALFSFKILPLVWSKVAHQAEHVDLNHVRWIFIGCGLLYFVGFTAMTLMLREGEYPPPPENIDGQRGLIASVKTYFVECFTHRFYLLFFAATTCSELVGCIVVFETLLQKNALGLSGQQVGNIGGAAMIVGACLFIPVGILADRFHPLRTLLAAMVALVLFAPLRLIYLFYNFPPPVAYKIEFALQMLLIPCGALLLIAKGPMYARLLPLPRLGQFSSAQAMVRSAAIFVLGFAAGAFLDMMKGVCGDGYYLGRIVMHNARIGLHIKHFGFSIPLPNIFIPGYHIAGLHKPNPNYYFKFVPIWTWLCYILALIFTIALYRHWKELGGDKGYKPPEVGCDAPVAEKLVTESVS